VGDTDLALYQYTPSTTAWETHSYTFNSGENTSVNFRFQAAYETGTYYIDNLSVATCEEPANDGHISNGDFEAGNTNWIDSANTAVVEDPTGANKGLVMSTDEAKNVTMFSQTAKNLKPNTYYNLSFNVYGFSTVSTNNSAFWVRFAKTITDWTITQSPNGSASANAYTPRINVNTKLNAWYPVNIKFNTGDLTETVINFMNYRTDGGQYYFDDIIVFEAKDPSYDGYIYNGDFECGTSSNWSNVSGGITHNADQVHDGTFALSMYTSGGWGGVGNQTVKNLVVGADYYISMWVRSDGAYLNGTLKDSTDAALASFPIRNNYTDWHFYDLKFTATETTATLNFNGPGKTDYAGYGYVDSIKVELACDRDGHSWNDATCTDPKTCACGATEGEALGHSYAETARVEATCGADGSVTYTCSVCGDSYTDTIPATGEHVYFDDCSAICEVCGYEREVSHNIVHVEALEPTCYEDGNIEYWYCDACGQAWLDEACTLNTNLRAVVLPMGHGTITHVEAKDATCYENGNIEYWYCEVCGQAWLDEACTLNTNLRAVVLPMGHGTITHVEAKDATCSENGNIEYWYCEVCGQAWLDEACTLNTNLRAVVLPMAAHTYDNEFDTACNVCGEIRNVELPISHGGFSIKEDKDGIGLAAKFDIVVSGMDIAEGKKTQADYTNATVNGYELISMGAIVTNGVSTKNVPAVYLCDLDDASASYAIRIIDIPADKQDVKITFTPYFTIKIDGEQVTVEGVPVARSYNG